MAGRPGRLNVKITSSTAGLNKGLSAASDKMRSFQKQTTSAGRAVRNKGGNTRRLTAGVQQLAFAVEDAGSVIGTSGFSGAVRAASNNISQFAVLLNPMAGIAVSAAIGIGTMATALLKSKSASEEAEAALGGFLERQQSIRQEKLDFPAFKKQIEGKGFEDLDSQAKSLKEELGEVTRELDSTVGAIGDANRRATDLRIKQSGAGYGAAAFDVLIPGDFGSKAKRRAEIQELEKQTAEAQKRRNALAEKRVQLEQRLEAVQRQRSKAFAKEQQEEQQRARGDKAAEEFEAFRASLKKREKAEAESAKRIAALRQGLLEESLSPRELKRKRILDQLADREQTIETAVGLKPGARKSLLQDARASAEKQLDAVAAEGELKKNRAAQQEVKSRLSELQRGQSKGPTLAGAASTRSGEAFGLIARAATGARVKDPAAEEIKKLRAVLERFHEREIELQQETQTATANF